MVGRRWSDESVGSRLRRTHPRNSSSEHVLASVGTRICAQRRRAALSAASHAARALPAAGRGIENGVWGAGFASGADQGVDHPGRHGLARVRGGREVAEERLDFGEVAPARLVQRLRGGTRPPRSGG